MVETAGTKLRRARTQRQLSLADAARATKIRASQLADLESDDYSNFANLAYARGFLVSYGKYLHLDVRPYMDAFADASTFGLDDYQYLNETPVGVYRAPTRQWRKRRQGNLRQFVGLAAAFVVLAVGVFSFYLYVNYQRLGGNLGSLAERQAAQALGERSNGEDTAASASGANGDVSRPVMVPVSSTPAPSETAPPTGRPFTPEIVPTNDDNRTAAATLAVSGHDNSPSALLTQLTMPALKSPGDANTPLSSPMPANDGSLLVRSPDKNADSYRNAPKPQKVSNNALE